MATENKKYIPALRFPEFQNDGEWAFVLVKNICSISTGKSNTQDQVKGGKYPFFIRSHTPVYSNRYLYDCEAVITIGDGKIGQVFHYINGKFDLHQRCYFMSKFTGVFGKYFYYYFSANFYKRAMRMTAKATVDSVRMEMISDMPFLMPSFNEQKKIADCLSSLDKYIDAIKCKLDLLKEHKKGLMQRLFPAKGKTTPELRFPEFQNAGEWQIVPLGEITSVVNRRNKSNRSLPIYSINNAEGFVPQSQQFAGMDSEARGYDISVYKIIGKHTFAYNPARINVGSIGYSGELKDILISSLYVCFKAVENVDDDFLMCFFNSYIFNQAVESNVEGGIRSYLFYENFSRISIAIPSLYEQKRIASCVTSIEDMIKMSNEQISLLETHKKGLLQQLFPMIK